jgi:ubiquinone/menaquinone biosynthesis C-methylase UbiE
MSDRAADFTGSIPAFYDHGLGPVFFADFADEIARRAAATAPRRVLEIAAGTGIVTAAFAMCCRQKHISSPPILIRQCLRSRAENFAPTREVEFQPPNAMALPFPDSSFDVVVCQFGVMFFPDKDKGYREAHRALVSGGRYLFSVWDSYPTTRMVA